MSYDIELYRLSGAGETLTLARQAREDGVEAGEPSAEADALRAKLAADLVALDPSLFSLPFDQGFSHGCWIDSRDPENCPLPNIDLGIDRGSIYFSYSADFVQLAPHLARILEVFERHGYTAYDPQTDSIVTAATGLDQSAASFAATRDEVVAQMHARGESVAGFPARRIASWIVTLAIFALAAVALLVFRHYYAGETPEAALKELRGIQERLK